jgi:predicted NBD/HSP70 family sugar kinase
MNNIKIGNSTFIKNLNQSSILRLINEYGPISRKELSEKTDYSAATISNHVKTFIEDGFVIEKEKGISSGGRKPVFLTINPNKGYIFGIDIEVNKVKIILFNLKLNVEEKVEFFLKKEEQPNNILKRIIFFVKKIMQNRSINEYDLIGIGITVPGLVDRNKSLLEFAPNLGWRKEKINEYFNHIFQVPIIIENEANAAALGEKEFNYYKDINMVYISINEGIGCGLIFNGKLYRGASGNAGEFGHIIIDSESRRSCHCGNNGCWETLASENYIYDRFLQEYEINAKNINEVYQELIKEKSNNTKLIDEIGENIGIGLANIINSLSPDLIVIGGNILKIKDYIDEGIRKSVKEKALSLNYKKSEIKYSKLKELASVYGVAKIIFDKNMLTNRK